MPLYEWSGQCDKLDYFFLINNSSRMFSVKTFVVLLQVWQLYLPVFASVTSRLVRPNRIVGGEQVAKGDMPWQVGLQIHYSPFCGGTLINDGWVVTAAHCTKGIDDYKKVVRVVLGAWDIRSKKNEKYKIDKVYVNKDFDSKTMQNDIALLHIAGFNSRTSESDGKPIKLETEKELLGKSCLVSGWGKLESGGSMPSKLRAAKVNLLTDTDCQNRLSVSYSYKVFESNLCAGGEDRDACQGDSGGPLVCCEDPDQITTCRLAGIVSWGIGCATRTIPGIYTEVAHFKSWILDTITEHDRSTPPVMDALFYEK